MNCSEFEPLLNAWIDGELAAEQEVAVREHIASCANCSALAESVRALHAELEGAFAGPVAGLCAAGLPEDLSAISAPSGEVPATAAITAAATGASQASPQSPLSQSPISESSGVPRTSIVSWICATAAALLILAFSWQRPDGNFGNGGSNLFAQVPAARLVVATGDVKMKSQADQPLIACAPLADLPPGWTVITGENSRCELTNSKATAPVRLDQNTELKHVADNKLWLENGRVWTATDGDFCLESPVGNIATKGAIFDFSCATDDSSNVLNVYEGEVDVTASNGANMQVRAGQSLQFANGELQSVESSDPVLGTRWINDILVKKGQEDQELIDRVEWLWIQITAKNPDQAAAYESEIRTLGSCAVRPLCDWVQSSASLKQPSRRAEAAKLLADLANTDAIPRLIDLLKDNDGDVRFHAAVALERLTGHTFGGTPEEWKALPLPLHQKARGEWDRWLDDKTKEGVHWLRDG